MFTQKSDLRIQNRTTNDNFILGKEETAWVCKNAIRVMASNCQEHCTLPLDMFKMFPIYPASNTRNCSLSTPNAFKCLVVPKYFRQSLLPWLLWVSWRQNLTKFKKRDVRSFSAVAQLVSESLLVTWPAANVDKIKLSPFPNELRACLW